MLHFDDEECDGEGGSGDGGGGVRVSSDLFIYNTFKNGSLSSIPLSPPTPVKTVKTDGGFSDQSPLVEYLEASPSSIVDDSMVTSLEGERVQPAAVLHKAECEATKEEYRGGEIEGVASKDRRLLNGFTDTHGSGVHLGKRTRDQFVDEEEDDGQDNHRSQLVEGVGVVSDDKDGSIAVGDSKRPCKSPGVQKGLHALNNLYVALELDPLPPPVLPSSPTSLTPPHFHHHTHQSHSEDTDKDSLTPSPIDFANVDPSIYDFDTAVLAVDSPGGLVGCGDHSPPLLPTHINVSASSSSITFSTTTQSSLHSSSVSPLSCSASISCSPVHCSLAAPLHFSSQSGLSLPVPSSQMNGCASAEHGILSLGEQKLSVLSADSMVMTTVSGASAVTTTATGVKGTSCSLQALMHNGGLVMGEEISSDSSRTTMSNGSGGPMTLSPEAGIEPDDDLGHIVDLLMT